MQVDIQFFLFANKITLFISLIILFLSNEDKLARVTEMNVFGDNRNIGPPGRPGEDAFDIMR